MPEVRRNGDKVTLEMTVAEYRDLTEVITTNGNAAWRHAFCSGMPFVQYTRQMMARMAWEWSTNIASPPLIDGEFRKFEINFSDLVNNDGDKDANKGNTNKGKAKHGKS